MRSDLAKLTTEKERRGSKHCASLKYGGKVRIVHDSEHTYDNEFGGFRSSARHRHQDNKSFSDVLNPIRGVLRKNLGRPWDKVYSEFCQFLDRRSVSGIHIFSHLCGRGGEVTVKGLYVGEDGKVYEHRPPGFWSRSEPQPVDGYYVHPVTGILRYTPPNYSGHGYNERAVLASLREGKNVEIDGHDFEEIDGCWFEVWYEKGSKEDFRPCYTQDEDEEWYAGRHYVKHHKTGVWGTWHYTPYDMVVRKRSLNKKQIQQVKNYIVDRIKELEVG